MPKAKTAKLKLDTNYAGKFPAMRSAELAHGMNSLTGDSSLPGGMLGIGPHMDSGVAGRNAKNPKVTAPKAPKAQGVAMRAPRPRNGGSQRGSAGGGATQ